MSGRKTAMYTLWAIIVTSGISFNVAQAAASAPAKQAKPKLVSNTVGQLLQRGYEQMRKGNYELAVRTLAAAVTADPDSVSARRYLAFALMRNGSLHDAMYQLLIIQRMAKASPFDNYTLGEAYSKMGKLPEAETCFKEALKTNPNYDPARASLIKTLSSTGKYDEAFTECLTGYKAAKTEMHARYYRILYQHVQEQKLSLRRMQDPTALPPGTTTTTTTPATTTGQTQSRTVGETRN
ncbi:MAG: tetratricopeptide repeat protein [Candidatus Melainabacteria bacterium]|nr:tetratricopeptide repeat protein [Candidatus Melainabacteria bacterium]